MSLADLDYVAYDPRWPQRFDALKAVLGEHLPDGVRIEHVGSTAVPGLSSKDCIDILVIAPDDEVDRMVGAIAAAGFDRRPASFRDDPGHHFFRLICDGRRASHVHLVGKQHPAAARMTGVRDLLRTNAEWRRAYQDTKSRLADAHPHNRGAYIAGKDTFMQDLIAEASP